MSGSMDEIEAAAKESWRDWMRSADWQKPQDMGSTFMVAFRRGFANARGVSSEEIEVAMLAALEDDVSWCDDFGEATLRETARRTAKICASVAAARAASTPPNPVRRECPRGCSTTTALMRLCTIHDLPYATVEAASTPPTSYDENAMTQVLKERDDVIEWADRLSYALGGDAIGEHSSGNFPWENALEIAEGRAAASTPPDDARALFSDLKTAVGRYVECDDRPRPIFLWSAMLDAYDNAAVYFNTGELGAGGAASTENREP